MADNDEVEPTHASSDADPSDAADSPTSGGFAGATAADLSGGGSTGSVPAERDDDQSLADLDNGGEEPELTEESVLEGDDYDGEFDDIVLNSGVGDGNVAVQDGPARDDTDDDALVLEPAGVAASTVNKRDADRRRARAPKDVATNKRDVQHTTERTTPVKFVKQSVGELRKVVYPTGQQLVNYFVVVLVFVLFIIAYVSLLDLGIGAAIFKIFA